MNAKASKYILSQRNVCLTVLKEKPKENKMKIREILYTTDRNLLQPDINKIIDKYSSRAKKRKSNLGYHSMMAYPFRVGEGKSWSKKYKKSINCNNPKGFSQKAHCAGRKKRKK